MKDEIKEILDDMKIVAEDSDDLFKLDLTLNKKDTHLLLDYITNLQTIEQQYSAILSENAELENKIIDLQDTLKDREELLEILEGDNDETI